MLLARLLHRHHYYRCRLSSTLAASVPSSNKIASARALANKLHIDWTDGITAQFPYVWLRDCAPTPRSSLADFAINVRPERLQLIEHGDAIVIDWPPYCRSIYASNWLRERIIRDRHDTIIRDQPRIEHWCKSSSISIAMPPHCTIDQLRVGGGDERLCAQMRHELLHRVGVVKVRNCYDDNDVNELLSLIGVETRTINECDQQQTLNVARSPQTSMPERATIPDIVIVRANTQKPMLIRATLTLVDAFHVATQLRLHDANMFEFLAHIPIEYVNGEDGMSAEHRLISTLGADGFRQV